MGTRNVTAAHFRQIDNRIQNISFVKGVEILISVNAWQKYPWLRKYFLEKPRGGYFIWVKKSISTPLNICLSLSRKYSKQDLSNLLLLDKRVKVKVNTICNALHSQLYGKHLAKGKIVLFSGARLEYLHYHRWGKYDTVDADYQFILENNSHLIYKYQNYSTPAKLNVKTEFYLQKKANVQSETTIQGRDSQIDLAENLYLQGKGSQGILRLKIAGRKASKITGHTCIQAEAPSKGHLDCQGLIVDKNTQVSLIPQLICKDKNALLTHEASLGKIKEEQLLYLRTRGLTQKEAINLIINGFLGK